MLVGDKMKKRCKFCKKEIGIFVKECPYCYEDQSILSMIWPFLLILLIIILFISIYFLITM